MFLWYFYELVLVCQQKFISVKKCMFWSIIIAFPYKMFNILYFELISLSRFKKEIYFTGYKRSDTTQSVQSVEELIVEEGSKADHQED